MKAKRINPVWINIINDKVTIEDAKALWGLNTYETQDRITAMVGGRTRFGDEWQQIGDEFTTARPQIVCIGPVGEARARIAALIHGSGVSGRTGGYGGVFGAKNLKAISVTGTGSVSGGGSQRGRRCKTLAYAKFPQDRDCNRRHGCVHALHEQRPETKLLLWRRIHVHGYAVVL